jgi:hypothetical protein
MTVKLAAIWGMPGKFAWVNARAQWEGTDVRGIGVGIILCTVATAAMAQEPLAPPAGAKRLLEVSAHGVQIYVCEPKDQGFAWVFDAPDATLFDAQGRQIGTHSNGPTWKLADGSEVLGEVIAKQPSPNQGSIPWLLLKVKSHQGSGQLGAATTVRRIETKGGAEPSGGCDAAHKGEVARVGYSATYQFFGQ